MEEQRTREMTVAVEGMHCESCAEKLQGRLDKVAGVRIATVSFAQHQARILYDPSVTEESRLLYEIEKSSFRVIRQTTETRAHGARRDGLADSGRVSERGWKSPLLSIPAILASLIRTVTCPLCITAYTALLSTLGLGFLMSSTYLLPLTVLLLGVAVAALGYEAVKRGAWGPFVLCLCGSAFILTGKFLFASQPATYAGVALLVGASIWNLAPRLTSFRSGPGEPRTAG
jgi:cation transport ATPase